jgi:hypothetical protein
LDSDKVFAVYDLKSQNGYPNGSKNQDYLTIAKNGEKIFAKIKSANPNLKAHWKE